MGANVLQRLGYVSLGVRDLDAATKFYTSVGQLMVTEKLNDSVFLSGGYDHHWLHLHESSAPNDFKLGYELVDEASLDIVADRLTKHGIPWKEGGSFAEDRLGRSLVFRDLNGIDFELFVRMVALPTPARNSFVQMHELLHVVCMGTDAQSAYGFYHDVLGFKPSDWIEERTVFLRSGNRYHHSFGFSDTGAPTGQLNHFCILVDSIDDVMRARNNALHHGAELQADLLRHAASGSISIYIQDPTSPISLEFCCNHGQIDDEGYRPRILPARPETVNVWLEKAPL